MLHLPKKYDKRRGRIFKNIGEIIQILKKGRKKEANFKIYIFFSLKKRKSIVYVEFKKDSSFIKYI